MQLKCAVNQSQRSWSTKLDKTVTTSERSTQSTRPWRTTISLGGRPGKTPGRWGLLGWPVVMLIFVMRTVVAWMLVISVLAVFIIEIIAGSLVLFEKIVRIFMGVMSSQHFEPTDDDGDEAEEWPSPLYAMEKGVLHPTASLIMGIPVAGQECIDAAAEHYNDAHWFFRMTAVCSGWWFASAGWMCFFGGELASLARTVGLYYLLLWAFLNGIGTLESPYVETAVETNSNGAAKLGEVEKNPASAAEAVDQENTPESDSEPEESSLQSTTHEDVTRQESVVDIQDHKDETAAGSGKVQVNIPDEASRQPNPSMTV